MKQKPGAPILEDIPGIGPTRKRALILHLGSARAVGEAKLKTLRTIPGISNTMAQTIYDHFHESDPADRIEDPRRARMRR